MISVHRGKPIDIQSPRNFRFSTLLPKISESFDNLRQIRVDFETHHFVA